MKIITCNLVFAWVLLSFGDVSAAAQDTGRGTKHFEGSNYGISE